MEAPTDESASAFVARRVRDLAAELAARAVETVGSNDPEAVHKARVATRRLRALLLEFGDHAPAMVRERAVALKKAGRRLGVVRDLDVLIEAFAAREDAADFDPVLASLRERETIARKDLRRFLASGKFEALLGALASAEAEDALGAGPTAVEAFREAEARLERVAAEGAARLTEAPTDAHLHALRIVHKRLRYLHEAVRDLNPAALPPRDLKRRVRYHRDLQDKLGAHQDAVVRLETVAAMVPECATLARQAVRLLEELDASRRTVLTLLGLSDSAQDDVR